MAQPVPQSLLPASAMPAPAAVERAIRLTYAQMMLNAVFGASTGGMFLIGFAMALGANDVRLGLMGALPQFFVLFQFLAALLVERGFSRKRLTVVFSLVTPLCWCLIATIPFYALRLGAKERWGPLLALLIGVICLATLAGQFAGNARGSWLGELIPAERRGRFFGNCSLFAGLVGAVFAVLEGRFLDFVKSHGLFAFAALFFFGAVFGLVSAVLNVPQPDCPLPGGGGPRPAFGALLRATARNKPFMILALTHLVVALGGIAGPFNAAYCLRDVGLSFFGLGLLNAVGTAAALIAAPLWGKAVDKVGCRPIIIVSLLLLAPCASVWFFIAPHQPLRAYWLLPWTNCLAGATSAGFGVAVTTMVYQLSRPEGRSVQFAAYSVLVTLISAPMPLVGGWLVTTLTALGWQVDLRLTFYAWMGFILLAAWVATFLHEPAAVSPRTLVFSYFPDRIGQAWDDLLAAAVPTFTALIRFQWPTRGGPPAPPA